MCGIWGMYGDNMTSVTADKFLQDAAAAGTVRGSHATGAFHVYWANKDKPELFANSAKSAVAGYEFSQSAEGKKILTTASNSLCVVGHNRYATGGGYEDESAHPFVRGEVTLVHNGVVDNLPGLLRTFGLDAKYDNINVDSDGVAAALASTTDPLDVLKELQGAYALVWFDGRTNSVYFAKNDERPLAFSRTKDGVVFASETGMLEWLMGRHGIKGLETGSLKSGLLVQCAYDGKSFKQVETRSYQHKGRFYGQRYYGGYDLGDEIPWGSAGGTQTRNWNHSQNVNGAQSARRTNKSGHDYGNVMDAIWAHLKEKHDIAPNAECHFSITGMRPTHGDTRGHMELIMQMPPYLSARRYFAGGRIDRVPYIDARLEHYLKNNWEGVHTVSAKINSVVLAKEAAQDGWMSMTTEEIIDKKAFMFFVMSEGMTCLEFADDSMTGNKVGFSAVKASENYDKFVAPSDTKTDLVQDALYIVTGTPKHVLRDVFKGNPQVVFKHIARSDPSMAVVQPVDNASVTMLQPVSSLKAIM